MMLLQSSGNPPLTVLFAILGAAVVGLCALAVGTWAGSARAAYLRRYNKAHGTNLPAGFLDEMAQEFMVRYENREIDWFGTGRLARQGQIWSALRERQPDAELERLRVPAYRRSLVARGLLFALTGVWFVVVFSGVLVPR